MGTRGRVGRRAALCCAVTLAAGLLSAGAAVAHATLRTATPSPNSVIPAAPATVVLVFDEPVNLVAEQTLVIGPDGRRVDQRHPRLAGGGKQVVIPLRPGLGPGPYTVGYRVVSADSHPVAGGYGFQVGSAGARPTGAGGGSPQVTASGDRAVSALYGIFRYLDFVGLLLLVGAGCFLVALWPAPVPPRRPRRLVWIGYGLTLGGTAGEFVLQVPYAAGTGLTGITGTGLAQEASTTFGVAHLVRAGLLILGVPLLSAVLLKPLRVPQVRWAAATVSVALIATWPLAGHSGARHPWVLVPSDTVHLAAMSAWLGGLAVLGLALLPATDGWVLRRALPPWSLLAMVSVALLVATGAVQALLEVGAWRRLMDTEYGRLVLLKVGLLGVILAVANGSRLWVRRHAIMPLSSGGSVATPRDVAVLRRGVLAETGLAVVVVAVAAVLVATTPARSALVVAGKNSSGPSLAYGRPVPGGPFSVALRRGAVVVHVVLDPARVGSNIVHLSATRPDQNRLPIEEWGLTLSNASEGLENIDVPLRWVGGQAVGDLTLPTPGVWTLRVSARTTDVDEVVMMRTLAVK